MTGLGRAAVRAVAAALALAACACEPLFHMCLNGAYGSPYYERTVREIPEDLRAAVAASTAEASDARLPARVCKTLCSGDDGPCELASIADPRYPPNAHVVCFSFREGGCPSAY
jgi:hypothetical protein